MIKKPCTVRGGAAESSSAKMANVTLDLKLLKCSVCCNTLVPPLFQCTGGHVACLGCCEELEYNCSLCGEPTNTRCYAVEHILGAMTVRCSFREYGCTNMIPFTHKLAHEKSCLHTPCYCPIAGCRPYARRCLLLDHINLQHPTVQYTNVSTGNLCPLRMRDGEPVRVVSLGDRGELFLLVVDRSVPSGRALSVIHLTGEPVRQDDFKYKIQVFTPTGILCLSGETQSVGRLTKAYKASASLFVPDAMWTPQDSPVYIELK